MRTKSVLGRWIVVDCVAMRQSSLLRIIRAVFKLPPLHAARLHLLKVAGSARGVLLSDAREILALARAR